MRLYVASTGSQANCYVLSDSDGESLVLDAGVPAKRVLPRVPDVRNIAGCLVTHEHNDHGKYWQDWQRRGIATAMSAGTWEALKSDDGAGLRPLICKALKRFHLGSFAVMPFGVQHDAKEPFGFLIRHRRTGETALYATDTYYLRYTFPGVNYWLVECNYCEDMVRDDTDPKLAKRLEASHMSLRRLRDALAANDLTEADKIVLVHLSDSRSDESRMVSEIYQDTGVETIAAENGIAIELSAVPF